MESRRRGDRRPTDDRWRPLARVRGRAELRDPMLIAAFEGWNDAGEAATARSSTSRRSGTPRSSPRSTPRSTTTSRSTARGSCSTRASARIAGHDPDPRRRDHARSTATSCSSRASSRRPAGARSPSSCSSSPSGSVSRPFVTLGALLADVPHTRPIPVTATSDHEDVRPPLRPRAQQATKAPPASSASSPTPPPRRTAVAVLLGRGAALRRRPPRPRPRSACSAGWRRCST